MKEPINKAIALFAEGLTVEQLESLLGLIDRAIESKKREEAANPQAREKEPTKGLPGMDDFAIAH